MCGIVGQWAISAVFLIEGECTMKTTLLSNRMFRAVLLLFAASWVAVSAGSRSATGNACAWIRHHRHRPKIAAGAVEIR